MNSYLDILKRLYQANANPDDAANMKAYLKNQFEFHGIRGPRKKELDRAFFKEMGLPRREELKGILAELYDLPEREYQHFAVMLVRKMVKKLTPGDIELLEYMLVHKSWWDTVDGIASWIAGPYFKRFPELIPTVTSQWMDSGNFWLQRTCLLFQLGYKEDTDTRLLAGFIEELADEKEFFIRKAIGWILRQYSKTNPGWVREFIAGHSLSPLSVREGSKYI